MFQTDDLKQTNLGKAYQRTYSGELIDLLDPKPEQIHIIDIAHALSMICRFNGHTQKFFSVAEHSIFVMQIMQGALARGYGAGTLLDGLMHDASEAYLNDLNGNLKKSVELAGYKKVEKKLEGAIQQRFGFKPLDQYGKDADLVALDVEGTALIRGWVPVALPAIYEDICLVVEPFNPDRIKALFLNYFDKAQKLK